MIIYTIYYKYSASNYIMYFFSSVFCITALFMHSTVLFNPEISNQLKGTTIYSILQGSFGVLVLFCFLFISFINGSFMKERTKEFGLFLTLGMMKKIYVKLL